MKIKESMVVKQCLEFLENQGYFAWRNNSGLMFIHGRRIVLGPAGSPDIYALMPDGSGRLVGVECKADKGRQSDNQKDYQKKLTQFGVPYLLVHSKEELEEKLQKGGIQIK